MTTLLAPIRPALPSFSVTAGELRALVAVARRQPGDATPSAPSTGADPVVLEALVLRQLLRRDEDGALGLPEGPLGGVIEVMAASHVQLQVRHITASPTVTAWFALTPAVGVELRQQTDESWGVTAFPTRNLLVRMVDLVGLVDREPPAVESFETDGIALEQCADRLALGDREAAGQSLLSGGASELSVRAFLGAFERRIATNAVVGSESSSGPRSSGVFAWFDSDDWGLWRVPLPDPSSDASVMVGSLSALGVCMGWANLLPVVDDPGWAEVIVPFGPRA